MRLLPRVAEERAAAGFQSVTRSAVSMTITATGLFSTSDSSSASRRRAAASSGETLRSSSSACRAEGHELRTRARPLVADHVEPGQHGIEVALVGRRLGVLAERRELARPERPAVALQRVRRPPRAGCVARLGGRAERSELGGGLGEEVVDQLGDELRIVAHAFAQLGQRCRVQRTPQLSISSEPDRVTLCFQAARTG